MLFSLYGSVHPVHLAGYFVDDKEGHQPVVAHRSRSVINLLWIVEIRDCISFTRYRRTECFPGLIAGRVGIGCYKH